MRRKSVVFYVPECRVANERLLVYRIEVVSIYSLLFGLAAQ